MLLHFKGGNELLYLKLNRREKKAQISSSKTFYKFQPIAWKMLFDKGKERTQEKVTDGLDDKRFKLVLIMAMNQKGYVFQNDRFIKDSK